MFRKLIYMQRDVPEYAIPLHTRRMNVTTLRHFILLSETLHFGRSSTRANISTSALSRHIRQLETELNVSLFERDNRTATLT